MVALVLPPKNTNHRPELEPRLAEAHRKAREAQAEAAAVLAEARDCGHHRAVGCASIYEFGERRGFSAREVSTLLQMQAAVTAEPVIGERVAARRFSLDAAAALSQVVGTPTLLPEKDAWIERAEHETAKELRSNIWKRLDEVRGTKTTWPLTANLNEDRWFEFERARALMAKDPKDLPGNDHVLGVLLDHYLDQKDILRQKGGTRRLPDTTGTRGHYIPADVKRIVHGRTRGRCAILKCTNTFYMEVVHETADCRGGCREPWNLGLRCSMHHHLKDSI